MLVPGPRAGIGRRRGYCFFSGVIGFTGCPSGRLRAWGVTLLHPLQQLQRLQRNSESALGAPQIGANNKGGPKAALSLFRTNRPLSRRDGRSRAGRSLLQRTRVKGILPPGLGSRHAACRKAFGLSCQVYFTCAPTAE
jgi:hypothetical protein